MVGQNPHLQPGFVSLTSMASGLGPAKRVLAFLDQSVSDHRLWGSGPAASADNRLNALINMIESAGYLMADGDYQGARELLLDADFKTDGEPIPPDFVAGSDASALASVILDLLEALRRE